MHLFKTKVGYMLIHFYLVYFLIYLWLFLLYSHYHEDVELEPEQLNRTISLNFNSVLFHLTLIMNEIQY